MFTAETLRLGLLTNLTSITLTQPSHGNIDTLLSCLLTLLETSKLETFQLYASGATTDTAIDVEFIRSLVNQHGTSLKKVAVQRLKASLEVMQLLCSGCPQLEQLFITIDGKEDVVGPSFQRSSIRLISSGSL